MTLINRGKALKANFEDGGRQSFLDSLAKMSKSFVGFRTLWTVQMYSWVLLVTGSSLFGSKDYLDQRDTVLINFPQRRNDTLARYLPPDSDYSLPEVIDNRAGNTSGVRSRTVDSQKVPLPDTTLQAPVLNNARDSRFYRRPAYLQTKQATRLTTSQTGAADISSGSRTIRVTEMSCQDSADERSFRVLFSAPSTTFELPVIDNVSNDLCKVAKVNSEYSIDIRKDHFSSCGVVDCSMESEKSFCLDVRFPVISGLRLSGDSKITLRCKVQDRTISHTKRISVKALDATGRALPIVITGGFKNSLDTEVGLFRKTYASENVFDTRIQSGGTVVLGEEILLRVSVKEGDGWSYSRISEVTIHFIEKKQRKKIMNSLTILDADGCLHPNVRDISSREQYRVSPLESYLIFQAFMFENMKETDEMILSVRILGCLHGADCALNCPAGHIRRSRSIGNRTTVDWQDDIAFRVILPKSELNNLYDAHFAIPYALFGGAVLTVIVLLWTIRVLLRRNFK